MSHQIISYISLLVFSVLSLAYSDKVQCKTPQNKSVVTSSVSYVGSESCKECHNSQFNSWRGSHHDLSMQKVSSATVLGNFNDVHLDYYDQKIRFHKKNDEFIVTTVVPHGRTKEFRIAYVFGVYPLQQYLVGFTDGRYQVLPFAWDSRVEEDGGQRWFHIYPNENIKFGDELHWLGFNQNWNSMCADCHSTNLEKNYDHESKAYRTSWSEIDVGCEACHGPASTHLTWAKEEQFDSPNAKSLHKGFIQRFSDRENISWLINKVTGNATRNTPLKSRSELDVCARCHARREAISSDFVPGDSLLNSFRPSLVNPELYHLDGSVKEEVYVYGSFLQSKMYASGVTCSDCHDPHSLDVKLPGNGLCGQCHSLDKYEADTHHHHEDYDHGNQCVDCHMPETNFMVIDERRDHSFKVPDISSIGSPDRNDVCSSCHVDTSSWKSIRRKSQDWWAAAKPKKAESAFKAAQDNLSNADLKLIEVIQDQSNSVIIRATALSLVRNGYDEKIWKIIQSAAQDNEPLMRFSSALSLSILPAEKRLKLGLGLLSDSHRVIRVEAVRQLVGLPTYSLNQKDILLLNKALEEFKEVELFNSDRPSSLINLSNIAAYEQDYEKARTLLLEAIDTAPFFVPAYINLADLFRAQGNESQAKTILETGLSHNAKSGALHHSLGLLFIRKAEYDKGLSLLKKAIELAPKDPRFRYVYVVALNSLEKTEEAAISLKEAIEKFENNTDLLLLGVTMFRDMHRYEEAKLYVAKLLDLIPENKQALALESTLKERASRH